MLYLAPIQGYTDVFFRSAYHQTIGKIDKYFTPFFELSFNKEIIPPNKKEILTHLNINQNLIPQLVAKNSEELIIGAKYFIDNGFKEMNLNLGCPFPMLVKRQKGCGALPYPTDTAKMLQEFFNANLPIELSIKTRLGLNDCNELPTLLPIINHLPIKELIIHFRLGADQYKGDVRWSEMEKVHQASSFKIVGNGDITTVEELNDLQSRFPYIENWMIGRGILINPLLALEINGFKPTAKERLDTYKNLHKALISTLLQEEVEQNRYMNSVKAFWFYHSQYYNDGRKIFKTISKTSNIANYNSAVSTIWNTISCESTE